MDLDATWDRYRTTGDVDDRNRLVEHHLPLVRAVVNQLAPFLARHADYEDLVSYGTLGLIDAVTKYDPATSTNFRGFAWKRIKGEILDELRRNDSVQRSLRSVANRIDKTRAELTSRHQRNPTDFEIATEMGITPAELAGHLQDLQLAERPISLNRTMSSTRRGAAAEIELMDTIPDDLNLADEYEIEELREVVAIAWNRLPHKEGVILKLRYVEGLTLTQMGEVLGVAPSRVSQLQSDAVRLLRTTLSVL